MITAKQITVYECVCDKCGRSWQTRNDSIPKVCSYCKSVNWNNSNTNTHSLNNDSIKQITNNASVIRDTNPVNNTSVFDDNELVYDLSDNDIC